MKINCKSRREIRAEREKETSAIVTYRAVMAAMDSGSVLIKTYQHGILDPRRSPTPPFKVRKVLAVPRIWHVCFSAEIGIIYVLKYGLLWGQINPDPRPHWSLFEV